MNVRFEYKPTPKQVLFHQSDADEVLYGGAAGGGKSYSICWDAFMRCSKWPGTHAYMFRRTYPELEMTLVKTMQAIVPETLGTYRAGMHEMKLFNGSVIHFCHLSNEGEGLLKYQGAEIHWLYFDELTHFTKAMYDYLRTRLRAEKKLGIVPCVRSASNPGGPGHGWVKARFVDSTDCGKKMAVIDVKSEVLGRTVKRRIQYIPATATDNPYLTQDYVLELEQKPKALREALLLGKWDAFDGQAFPEFTNDKEHYEDGLFTHVIKPFKIPYHWPRYVSFDHGYTKPFSIGVWAVDEFGRAYRYKECYGCVPNEPDKGVVLSPSEIGDKLADLLDDEFRDGIRPQGIADPAIWDRSRGMSVEEQIRKRFGGVIFRPGDNTRLPGKMQLHERLKFDDEGKPMLYVFENCRDFIRTIPTLVYDPRNPEDIDTAGEDHIYDETRYFLMSRPIAPRPIRKAPKRMPHPLD